MARPDDRLSFTHIFIGFLEGDPGEGEVEHAAEAGPEGLGAGGGFGGAIVVASQVCQDGGELIQCWWSVGWLGFVDDLPGGLPFLVDEDCCAGELRTGPIQIG